MHIIAMILISKIHTIIYGKICFKIHINPRLQFLLVSRGRGLKRGEIQISLCIVVYKYVLEFQIAITFKWFVDNFYF